MSHLSTITTKLKDMDVLREALSEHGLALDGAGDVRTYGRSTAPAEHVLHLPGPYDIGFNRQEDGTYSMVCDGEVMYERDNRRNSDVLRLLGPGCGKMFQSYAAVAATRAGLYQNFTASRELQEDGSLVLTLRR